MAALYTQLFSLLEENTALWHGDVGGKMIRIWTDKTDQVFSFTRENSNDKVLVLINFSDAALDATLIDGPAEGSYTDYFTQQAISVSLGDSISIPAHGWRVLVR
jgi:glycosidase